MTKRKNVHQIADELAERLAPVLLALSKAAVTAEYGERCPDDERGCPICDAWRIFDRWGICPTADQLRDFSCKEI
jgi:hypothetical protein